MKAHEPVDPARPHAAPGSTDQEGVATRDDRARVRFQTVLDGSPIASLLLARGEILAANPAACDLLGHSELLLREIGLEGIGLGSPEWADRIAAILRGDASAAQWPAVLGAPTGALPVQLSVTGIPREDSNPPELVAVVQLHPAIPDDDVALNLARQRYERLVDSAQEGIWEVDEHASTVFANQRMAEILGLSLRELLGRSLFDFLDDDMVDLARSNLAARRTGASGRFDIRYRRADGAPVWTMVSSIPLIDGAGTFRGAAATVVDITERRRQEAELRAAEEQFRRTFDAAPIGMALVSPDGRWLQVNDSLCRLLGRGEEELLALTFADVTHPDDIDADLTLVRDTLAGHRSGYAMEKRYLHALGHVIWVRLTVALLRDDAGVPVHFVSQIEDVTERRHMETELRDARQQLEQIVANAAVAMALVRWDGAIVEANPRFAAMFGADNAHAGAGLSALIQSTDQPRVQELLDAGALGRGDHVQAELAVVLQGGATGYARFELAPLPRAQPPTLIVQVLDVTVERNARVELEHLATHDPLTGALNRRGFESALDAALARPNAQVAVLFADLDGFKAVNDTLGHDVGDLVLVDVAHALNAAVRAGDSVARLGGDEFAVLCHGLDDRGASEVAERVGQLVAQIPERQGLRVTISVGLAAGGSDPAELVRRADDAMLEAKRRRHATGTACSGGA